MPRSCVFCRREGKLTLEHVLPRWIVREMPDPKRITRVVHTQSAEGEELRKWTTDELDIKVKRVCASCNNGWMSELEKAARHVLIPLMSGKNKKLLPVEQEILSVWAIKTSLMCEFLHPSRGASDEHYRDFYDGLKATPNAHVWISSFHVPERLDYHHRVLQFPGSPDGSVPDRLGYLSAFIINRLVLYVMDVATTGGFLTRTTSDDERRVLPVHPIKHAILRWPPQFALDAQGVEEFLVSIAPTRFDAE